MLRLSLMACAAAVFLVGAASQAAAETEIEGVTVIATADVRLTVAIGGQIGPDQVVTSAPVGLRCGGAEYQYITRENRQCWLRVRRNSPVLLTAQGRGAFGRDWTVTWSGCQPVAGGAACELRPGDEAVVAAVFSQTAPTPAMTPQP